MHQTLTIGRATYIGKPDTLAAIFALQHKRTSKPRPKPVKRVYPQFHPGMSTADYVRDYFSLNKLHALNNCSDQRAFFSPLNTEPATLPSGEETVEIIE